MSFDLEIMSPSDRPALIGISSPDILQMAQISLEGLGFKIHTAGNPEEFMDRFSRVQYEVVLIEDIFGGNQPDNNIAMMENTFGGGSPELPESNVALLSLQNMQMPLRRHATVILIGEGYATLNPMQAFQQSVHAVINRMDTDQLSLILQQVVSESAAFLNVFKDVQAQIARGRK